MCEQLVGDAEHESDRDGDGEEENGSQDSPGRTSTLAHTTASSRKKKKRKKSRQHLKDEQSDQVNSELRPRGGGVTFDPCRKEAWRKWMLL